MANQLPVTVDFGAIPLSATGYSPQQFADRMGLNARVFTEQSFALFTTGSTAPTSDTGPWAKNGNTWYYWDSGTGAYVPFLLDAASLKYSVSNVAPDPTIYLFWIELDGAGSPLALKTYFGGAWVDVYATVYQPLNANLTTITTSTLGDIIYSSATNTLAKLAGNTTATKKFLNQTGTGAVSAAPAWAALVAGDIPDISATYLTVASAAATYHTIAAFNAAIANYSTTAQMNTAIDNAVVAGDSIFKAKPAATQDVVFGGAGTSAGVVTLGTEVFDPDNRFAANTFTAPVAGYYMFTAALSASVTAGTPTSTDIRGFLGINGSAGGDSLNDEPISTSLNGRVYVGSTVLSLALNDTVDLRYSITLDAAGTVTIDDTYTQLTGYRIR